MMANKDDPERQAFLAMMIQELSRQQTEDAVAFAAPPPPAEDALFRKMCFDFPEITDDSLNLLVTATNKHIDKVGSAGTASVAAKSAFDKIFCLHETFVENVVTMCTTLNAPTDGTVGTVSSTTPQGKHKLATVIFLRVPKLLLLNNTDTLLPLLNTAPNTITWRDVVLRFQSFVALSTVSIIAAGSGSAAGSVQQLLADSACLADLCAVVDSLGAFLTQAEHILAQVTTTKTAEPAAGSTEDASAESAPADNTSTVLSSLSLLDSLGKVSTSTSTSGVASLHALLQTLLTNAANTTTETTHTQVLAAVVSVIKSSWLHLTFLGRDLLLLFPALIPKYAPVLFKALHKSETGFSMRKSDFPTSAECLYVLVLSSVAAHVCGDVTSSGTSNSSNSGTSSVVVLTQAKDSLRAYLESGDTLSTVVTLCGRMNKYAATTTGTTTTITIDAESSGFLLDLALLYLSEPGRVRTTTHSSVSGAVPVLVSSQLLSTLCVTLVAVLQQVCADRQKVGVVHAPAMLAFTARLGRFFSLLPVALAQRATQNVILKYLLDFPDLLPLLTSSCDTEEVQQILPNEAGIMCAVPTLFTPVQCMGVSVPLLLAAHSSGVQPSTYVVPAAVVGALLRDAGGATGGVLALLNGAAGLYRVAVGQYAVEKANNLAAADSTDTAIATGDGVTSTDATADSALETSEQNTVKSKMTSDKAHDSSDSDNEEKQTLPIIPPSQPAITADSAAAAVHKKALHQATTALIATINSLCEVLSVVVGDGAGGPSIRLLCAVKAAEQPPNRRSMNSLVHNTLTYFATEAARAVQGNLGVVAQIQELYPTIEFGSTAAPLVSKCEAAKKLLKALQELLQGGSSKGD